MSAVPATESTASETPAPGPPRLSILILLIWVTLTALLLFVGTHFSMNEEFSRRVYGVDRLLLAIGESTALIVACSAMGRCRHGGIKCLQPGEWLAAGLVGPLLLWQVYAIIATLWFEEERLPDGWGGLFAVVLAMGGFAQLVTLLAGAIFGGCTRVWRVLLIVMVVAGMINVMQLMLLAIYLNEMSAVGPGLFGDGLWQGLLGIFSIVSRIAQYGLITALPAVIIYELVKRRRYAWLHWAGVASILTLDLLQLLWQITFYFFPPSP